MALYKSIHTSCIHVRHLPTAVYQPLISYNQDQDQISNVFFLNFHFPDKHEVQMQNGETRDTRLLTDDDVNSCITVPKTTENGRYFKARFPWPVLGSSSETFVAKVTGNNICCHGEDAVKLYTPLEGNNRETPSSQDATENVNM